VREGQLDKDWIDFAMFFDTSSQLENKLSVVFVRTVCLFQEKDIINKNPNQVS
jgi:hypothetical protein